METDLLLATLAFIIPMCFTPGPNNLLCAAHGSQHGLRGTMPLILGMAIGWSTLGLFVGAATVFIEENEEFFQLLTYVGAAYISYLPYKLATSSPSTPSTTKRTAWASGPDWSSKWSMERPGFTSWFS